MKTASLSFIRNVGIASGLTLLSLVGLASSVKAQSTTPLEVVITSQCALGTVPTYASQSVSSSSLITPGLLGSGVQNINLVCNNNPGFTLSATSAKGSLLTIGAATTGIAYTVTTNSGNVGVTVNNVLNSSTLPAATSTTIAETSTFSPQCATSTGCNVGFSLALVTPTVGLPAGTYTDTITYTLAGK